MKTCYLWLLVALAIVAGCKRGDKGDPGPQGASSTVYEYTGTMPGVDYTVSVPALTTSSFVRIILSVVGDANNYDDYPYDTSYDYPNKTITLNDPIGDTTGRTYRIIIHVPASVQSSANSLSSSYLKGLFRY